MLIQLARLHVIERNRVSSNVNDRITVVTFHLVCLGCGTVSEAPIATAAEFAGNVREATGFDPDVTHMAIHGWCASCREKKQ